MVNRFTGQYTKTVPNMVQGVSQQATQVRRPTQAESQFDCLNHPVEGCTPRPGLTWMAKLDAGDNTDAFFYRIIRTDAERYVVLVRKDGTLKAFNFLTGVACTIVGSAPALANLATTLAGTKPWNTYAATSADDVTFIANKAVSPAMKTTVRSTLRPYEALFYIKAGGYLNTYQIGIKKAGTWYNWSYQTPDNSVPANAAFVAPSAICYALYNAMVTDPTHPIATGLGFNIEREGNLIRLWSPSFDFDIKTDDGQNNTFMLGMKEQIRGFDQLPQSGWNGMVFKIQGDKTVDADDYFVKFNSKAAAADSTTQGVWEETVAEDTVLGFDANTMPVALVNDNVNHFTLGVGSWGQRLAGDGIVSAKDPSFVGRYIEDVFFDQKRLAIMTKAACCWSRTDNPYVFFPDTVQVGLDTSPIDAQVKASKRIAVLRKPLQAGNQTYLWAEGQQLLVSHVNTSIFSNSTIEVDPSSTYEWQADVAPLQVGATSVLFTTEVGKWSAVTDATYENGKGTGETGLTDHVPKYIPKDVRYLVSGDTVKKSIVISETTPNVLYLYEYRISGGERLQSAWHTWRLPTDCHVVYALIDKHLLYVFVQRTDGLHLLRCSLQPSQEDPEGGYLTRLDMMVDDTACTTTYNSGTNKTTIVLPTRYDDAQAHILGASADNPKVTVVVRATDATYQRGQILSTNAVFSVVSGKTNIVIDGDHHLAQFYVGFRIRSERTESTFFMHDANNAYVYTERIELEKVVLSHANSGYFRAELLNRKGEITFTMPYEGKAYGDPTTVYDKVILGSGNFDVPISQVNTDATVRFVSDTYLPCSWQSLIWHYVPTIRAIPGG